ncbi:hypothetical protein [Sphingorhabdus sp.]|uniref:hypothetical protein n=1 Tax=Sphingorhabdus sp. TaxID=1902408 RepID=UPI0032B80170
MGHGAFRGVLIGVGLIVFVIFSFKLAVGGIGLFAASKLDSRAEQIEAQMIAELPADISEAEREHFKEKAKLLARSAAEMEASGMISGKSAIPKLTSSISKKSVESDSFDSSTADSTDFNDDTDVGGKNWEFGDPSSEIQ